MTYLRSALAALQNALNQKANASTVGGLATQVASKASQSSVDALAATVPTISTDAPLSEANSAAAGVDGMKVLGSKHQHPRLTSTTGNTISTPASHVIGASGTVVITFTQQFDVAPGCVFTEVPPPSGSMSAQPAIFRVESWTITAGKYVGCTVRAWRSQPLPTLTPLTIGALLTAVVTGINNIVTALTGFNIFAASATGTAFTCIAVKRSDS